MFTPSKYCYTPKTPKRKITTLSSSSEKDKDPVKVYCRLIPLQDNVDSNICIEITSPQELCVSNESKGIRKNVFYKFKHIFSSHSTQKEVFDHVGYSLVEDLLNGKNGLLFAYGVTGSGKTYTLTGDQNNPGIVPRCVSTIFNSIEGFQTSKYLIKPDRLNSFEVQSEEEAGRERVLESRVLMKTPKLAKKVDNLASFFHNDGRKISNININRQYAVFISYIEIYNNNVYDLLDDCSTGKIVQNKILRKDVNHNMYVNGVVEIEVKSAQEAFELLLIGQRKKKTAYTNLNSESSRSHSVFNLRIVQLERVNKADGGPPSIDQETNIVVSNLSLTDLAGSERSNRTQISGIRLKEASSINNSLMTLRTCLETLRENQLNRGSIKLVPYRDSRLTHLFKNYFDGDGSVQMIVCVNPTIDNLEENLHVMKFAEITQDIKILRTEPKLVQKSAKKVIAKKGSVKAVKEFPVFKFDVNNVEEFGTAIDNVLKALSDYNSKTKDLDTKICNKSKEIRKRLIDVSDKDLHMINEINDQKILLQRQRAKTKNFETKVVQLDTKRKKILQSNKEYETLIQTLHNRVDEKQLKINQSILEKNNNKERVALVTEKMRQDLENKVQQQREILGRSLLVKEVLLSNVRKALETEDICGLETMDLVNISPPSYLFITPEITVTPPDECVPRRRSKSLDEVWKEDADKSFFETTYPSSRKRKSNLILKDVSNKQRILTKKTEIEIVLMNNSPIKTVVQKENKVSSQVE